MPIGDLRQKSAERFQRVEKYWVNNDVNGEPLNEVFADLKLLLREREARETASYPALRANLEKRHQEWDWGDLALTGVGSLVVVWFGVTYRLWGWSYSRLAGFALGSSGVSQTAIVNAMRSGIGFSLNAQRHSASVKPEAK
ncbi:hypothetical protein AEAE_0423 [Aeriscardovia aeriphila]|uniref:Uncharacterized protein n=1 Tax=Aeriscardovia aeriphila TaxID=218139 RepID=A0A261FA73_9BIFI|nr:hypothetical protein AEAE_0423 [Aeriscardovia aeriphila]